MNKRLSVALWAAGSFSIQSAQIKNISSRAIHSLTKADIPDIMKGQRTV